MSTIEGGIRKLPVALLAFRLTILLEHHQIATDFNALFRKLGLVGRPARNRIAHRISNVARGSEGRLSVQNVWGRPVAGTNSPIDEIR